MTSPSPADAHAVAELYAALSIDAETHVPSARVPSRRAMVAYVTDPDFDLSDDELAAIAADPALDKDFDTIRRRLGLFAVPTAAAASDGPLTERRFPGAAIRLVPLPPSQDQVAVIVLLDHPQPAPRKLLLKGTAGVLVAQKLPAPDSRGRLQFLKDKTVPGDAAFLDLIGDAATTGTFS